MCYVLSPNIFTLNSATQLLATEDISKNIYPHHSVLVLLQTLYSWPRLFNHRSTWLLLPPSWQVQLLQWLPPPPTQHERVFTSSPALLNWLVSRSSCVCLVWCSIFYFFTNPGQNSFSYVFKGREYESSIILESDSYISTAMTQVLHTFNMVMTAASFCFQGPPLWMPYLPLKSCQGNWSDRTGIQICV